jgi:hypothetical protein
MKVHKAQTRIALETGQQAQGGLDGLDVSLGFDAHGSNGAISTS